MAPLTGFEPITLALTVLRSTIELQGNGGLRGSRTPPASAYLFSSQRVYSPSIGTLAIMVLTVGFEPTLNGA